MSTNRLMATEILRGAALVAGLIVATNASARLPAPLIPSALVEDVKSASAGVDFMDYVGNGQVINLQPGDVLVLSYLKSCEHETITGGTVTIGADQSEVRGGKIVRTKVACDGGKVQLPSQQAGETAATAFRLQSASQEPTLYGRSPVIEIPRLQPGDSRVLVIERTDRPGQRFEFKIADALADGGFYDLAKTRRLLTPGATYRASIADHKIIFKVDPSAKAGRVTVVSRLLRFQ
jgi:hypothetical protein